MTVEGKDEEVVKIQPDEEGKIAPDKEGKFPEVVSWNQYVKTKETIGGKLTAAQEKVKSLEEQLSNAVKQDDFKAVQSELEKVKAEYQQAQDELKGIKDKSIEKKREYLKSKSIPEEKYANASDETLDAMIDVLESYKSKPDTGGGGSVGTETLSAKEKMIRGFEQSSKRI